MKHFYFRYIDIYSNGQWSYTDGVFSSIEEAIEWYGFNTYGVFKYELIKEEEING